MKRLTVIGQRQPLDLPMTPMIDVVFQLIIFFLCTTRFTPPERVLVTPVEPLMIGQVASPQIPQWLETLEVVIKLSEQEGKLNITMNNRNLASLDELGQLLQEIAKIRPDVPVILDPEPAVKIQHVITVYDTCREVGFLRVQFATPVQP